MASEAQSSSSGPGGAEARAEEFRFQGNEYFEANRHTEAAACYRQALALLDESASAAAEAGSQMTPLGRAVRLNLAACLQRLGVEPAEVVQLCSEVLEADSSCAKALFRRGMAQREIARSAADAATTRQNLAAARSDFLKTARLQPSDRQVRSQLDETTEELKAADRAAGGLGLGMGLYDDREIPEPPPPPVVCSTCGREGHPQCGRALWVAQRAAWLGMPVSEVDRDPPSFDDDGTLRAAIRAARGAGGASHSDRGEGAKAEATTSSDDDEDLEDGVASLSETEQEMLEDCICAIDRPYPELKRKLSLPRAVRCAEQLWDEVG
mmetsp:Transcript_115216/g.332827  ORF Transcript_115216/g.332827 Transcript_115216/m.332827 type:complete len:324 (+) Transcript_115216:208-1179(+)